MFGMLRQLLGKGVSLPRALFERLAPVVDPVPVEADSAPGSVVSAPRMLTVTNADGTVWHMPIPPDPTDETR